MADDWNPDWTFTFETETGPERRSAARSFQEMDAEAQDPVNGRELSSGTTSCPKPWLEVYVFDAAGEPVEGVPCKLAFPEGGGQQKPTGADGKARFEDLGVDVSTLTTKMVEDDPDADPPKVHVEVVPLERAEAPADSRPKDEEVVDVPGYVDLGWHDL